MVATQGWFLGVVMVVVGRVRSHEVNLRGFARLRPIMVTRTPDGRPARLSMATSMSVVDCNCAVTSKRVLVGGETESQIREWVLSCDISIASRAGWKADERN